MIINSFEYDGTKLPFKNNVCVLVGENGCGKSYALNMFQTYLSDYRSAVARKYAKLKPETLVAELPKPAYYQATNYNSIAVPTESSFTDGQAKAICDTFNKVYKDADQQLGHSAFGFSIHLNGYTRKRLGRDLLRESDMSAGQRHLFNMLLSIYARSDSPTGVFVILDEPEASLDIEKQRRLLPAIKEITFVKGILVATQSPFIFDNDLDTSATVGMGMCATEKETT